MKLSPVEETFLRRWMWEDLHLAVPGPAKALANSHRVPPASLVPFIRLQWPNPLDQIRVAHDEPPTEFEWPWPTPGDFQHRAWLVNLELFREIKTDVTAELTTYPFGEGHRSDDAAPVTGPRLFHEYSD